jgi:hypothetical protein
VTVTVCRKHLSLLREAAEDRDASAVVDALAELDARARELFGDFAVANHCPICALTAPEPLTEWDVIEAAMQKVN